MIYTIAVAGNYPTCYSIIFPIRGQSKPHDKPMRY